MDTVELEHEWTRERQTVSVHRITASKVTIRFPIIGSCLYELDVASNTVRAMAPATRRKHPFCLWRAADISAVRRAVWIHFHPNESAVKKSIERHNETMPLAKRENVT